MGKLVSKREGFHLAAAGKVEIRVCSNDGHASVWYQCSTCDYPMTWNVERSVFDCSDCGYEMTVREADDLCQWTAVQIDLLANRSRKRKSWVWRLLHWFRGNKLRQIE